MLPKTEDTAIFGNNDISAWTPDFTANVMRKTDVENGTIFLGKSDWHRDRDTGRNHGDPAKSAWPRGPRIAQPADAARESVAVQDRFVQVIIPACNPN
ncbi:hypothetical protein [Roseobacter sp. GAI101]|uniref:hypothetical protein n=1 Tax=Roseobacter sp. (strain GAI101) TaxID=391589 RepID=UPI00018726B0|nr:hypothetical protein [Roseobacter sp. GAI101]EEB84856.1 hypothetical protein RGAI101_2006 [Roseobacter sp. GAI101]